MVDITPANTRSWSRMGARGALGMAILELAQEREDVIVLSADTVRSSGLDRMQKKYPDRVINTGIAEQNLIGVASGLANEGAVVFTTALAPFISLRASEQIRMNLGYMQQNVKAVGVGAGIAFGPQGNSHFCFEDLSVMRSIPGITVISPADGAEIFKTVFAAAQMQGPVYIRLTGVLPNPIVYREEYDFEIGKAVTLREGGDAAIIASGTMVHYSLKAAELLEQDGISASVINMHTIKPLDIAAVKEHIDKKAIITVEEHSIIGGLGSAVAECLASEKTRLAQLMLGLPDKFGQSGAYEWLLEKYGLLAEGIAESVREFLKKL